jgi:hypothetical protein
MTAEAIGFVLAQQTLLTRDDIKRISSRKFFQRPLEPSNERLPPRVTNLIDCGDVEAERNSPQCATIVTFAFSPLL